MAELGTLLKNSNNDDELAEPIFIWEIIEENGKYGFLINSESGMSKNAVEAKFPEQKIILPNHAKFKLLSKEALEASFSPLTESSYPCIRMDKIGQKQSKHGARFFY